MGRALYTQMKPEISCATIEIMLIFVRSDTGGQLVCETRVLHRGCTTEVLEFSATCADKLVVKAQGTYAVFPRTPKAIS